VSPSGAGVAGSEIALDGPLTALDSCTLG